MAVAAQARTDRNRLPLWKRALFSMLTFCLTILVLELVSAFYWSSSHNYRAKVHVLGLCRWRDFSPSKLPNTFWHHGFNPDDPEYKGHINRHGTKGVDFELPKPDGEFRVVCIGDSTVEGVGPGSRRTFPLLLEQMLAEDIRRLPGSRSVAVINAGIGSHNSAFNLAYLAFRLIHFEPDVVVIKSTYNDYLPYCMPGMGLDYTHAFPNPYHCAMSRSSYWDLARHSYLLKVLGLHLFRDDVVIPFPDFAGHLTAAQLQRMDYSANVDRFFVYRENIRSMILLCRGRNIGVIILDLPTPPGPVTSRVDGPASEGFASLMRRLEQELAQVTDEEGVPFVRTGPFDAGDFFDDCHNTPAGHEKIARKAAEALFGVMNERQTRNAKR